MDNQRRRHNRYQLKLPVIFSWRNAQHAQHEGVGLTHDLSIAGAFIATPSPPPLNANIKFMVLLPLARRLAPPIGIQGEGQVIRVEDTIGDEAPGCFAVGGNPFVLQRGEEYRLPRTL